jgi:hypothetical protein
MKTEEFCDTYYFRWIILVFIKCNVSCRICNLKITEIIADMFRISQIFYDFKSADR